MMTAKKKDRVRVDSRTLAIPSDSERLRDVFWCCTGNVPCGDDEAS
jgi:hypothetical protein